MTVAVALLDANVLYPAPLRDLLLQMSFSTCFRHAGRQKSTTNGNAACWPMVPMSSLFRSIEPRLRCSVRSLMRS